MFDNILQNWVKKMGETWKEKNPLIIPSLFSENFQYFETPFEKPLTAKKDLIKLWQEVPSSQKDIKFTFEVLSSNGNTGIINWHAVFTRIPSNKRAELDGIFYIKLNRKGLCTLFKQWWISR
jgi:hypothetical protein